MHTELADCYSPTRSRRTEYRYFRGLSNLRTWFVVLVQGVHENRICIELRALSSTDTARMASTEEESIKNSQKLTTAALEISNVAKDDKDNEETAEIKKEDGSELPIRDTPKEAKTTPDEGKAEDDVDVAALQKDAVAVSFKSNVFQHRFENQKFIPLILPSSVAEDEKTVALETVRDIKLKHVDVIDAKLWQRWAQVQCVSKYTGKASEELFEEFIKQEYFHIIRAVQTESQKNEFQSLYDVNVGDADETTQKKRALLIEAAQPSDTLTLEQRLDEKWKETLNLMPQSLKNRLPPFAAEQFREDEYYTVLENVVKERQKRASEDPNDRDIEKKRRIADAPLFRALYDVGIGGVDADTQAHRLELIKKAIPNDSDEIAAELNEAWKILVNKMPQSMRLTLPQDAAAKYREECYFDTLEQVIKRRKTKKAASESESTLIPEYPIEINSDDVSVHVYRSSLLNEARPRHEKAINALLSKKWQEHIDELAPFERAHLPPHAENTFRKHQYYKVLETVIGEEQFGRRTVLDINLKVLPTEGASSDELHRRKQMLACITPEECKEVEIAVEELWNAQKRNLPQSVRVCMPEEPTQDFWVEHYYDVMTSKFGSKSALMKETVKQTVSTSKQPGIRSPSEKKRGEHARHRHVNERLHSRKCIRRNCNGIASFDIHWQRGCL